MMKRIKHIQFQGIIRSLKTVAVCALLCFTAQSCNQELPPHTPETEEIPISMSASAVESMESTRALITNDAGLQAVGFGVYATKTVASSNSPILVFNNEEVYYSSSWKYDNTKYWDRTATYNFVAYAPYSSESAKTVYVPENNTLTINNIPYWQTINGQEIDYLVANSSGTAESYLNNPTSTAVPLSFSHILSQFVVKIVKDDALANVNYILKKVDYINVPASDGNATYTYNPSGTSSFSDISIISSSSSVPMLNSDNGETVTKANSDDTPITLSHLVVPFTLSGDSKVQIKVTYTIEGTERNKTVETQIVSLNAGKCNELTLTFKGSEIIPSLSVKDWQNVEKITEDPKYNW